MSNIQSKQTFASYLKVSEIPYIIIKKLALSETNISQKIWKLLKYTTTDALEKPNLTFEEKMEMVWTPDKQNSTQQNLFTVFLKPLISSSLNTDESQTQLKIFRNTINALDQYSSVINFEFNVIVNEMASMAYNENNILVEKTDLLESLLLDELQGLDLGVGSSNLMFTRMSGGICNSQLSINNGKSLYGRSFIMALRYFNNSKGGVCN